MFIEVINMLAFTKYCEHLISSSGELKCSVFKAL